MKKKFLIKKNDVVQIIAGKDKGKQGKVLRIFPDKDRVLVEGLNQVKKHQKPTQANPQGGIIDKAMPVHISNVMYVDPKSAKPTRIGKKWVEDKKAPKGGRWQRVAKASGELLK